MRHVLITGAASGIGKSTAFKFAKAGFRVFILDKLPLGEEVAAEIQNEYGSHVAEFRQADIASFDDVAEAVRTAGEWFDGRLDVLVNNAGTIEQQPNGRFAAITDVDEDLLQRQFTTNVFGAFYMVRNALPLLRASDTPTVINICSAAARGLTLNSHYSASKGAVESFTRSMALELAPDVAVIGIAPGLVETALTADMTAEEREGFVAGMLTKRMVNTWEIANQIVHVAHPDSRSFTGQVIHINGGLFRAMP